MSAEFTAIGAIYTQFITGDPSSAYIPIVVVAVVTTAYSAAGGLYISILTDVVQSVFLLLLLAVMAVYIGITYRVPIPSGPLPPYLDVNQVGLASIMTLGVALISSTMFSDAVWQRVWSAKDDKALIKGSIVGAITVIY